MCFLVKTIKGVYSETEKNHSYTLNKGFEIVNT